MTSLQWYMAKTSLYLDLGFICLSASSIYTLILALDNEATRINFLILGMNLAILSLSKEFGIFQTWFIIVIIYLANYNSKYQNTIKGLIISLFVLSIFIFNHYGFSSIFSFGEYKSNIIIKTTLFRFSILLIILPLLILSFIGKGFKGQKPNLINLIIFISPLFTFVIYIIYNLTTYGSPIGYFTSPYAQKLFELGVNFSITKLPDYSFLSYFNILLTNSMMANNLVPFIVFILNLIIKHFKRKKNFNSSLLASWFFYSLFEYYFISMGSIDINPRQMLPLIIPLAIIVGQGIQYLVSYSSWENWIGTVAYTSITSAFIGYLWFLKLDGSKWWGNSLDLLSIYFAKASYIEVLIYAMPWLFIIFILISKISIGKSIFFSKKIRSLTIILLLLISSIPPMMILGQAIRYPKIWNPAYYDKPDSVRIYTNHWCLDIIDFYNSQLVLDNSTTIGFGVTPLQYFFKRPFIDLINLRNWLIYLPLINPISTEELLQYLENLNVRYFLIPTELSGRRARYEDVLINSTLFKLISKSAIVTRNDGQVFHFKRIARFQLWDLYVLTCL